MSQEKINFLSLAGQLANKAGVSRKEAEDFLKLFALVVEEALENQDQVKIKGLGTLKPQWNAPRKSVDVNTGEEITLAGYFKINFSPEASLKDAINAPYAHLETVILPGGLETEQKKSVSKEEIKPVDEPKQEAQGANLDYFNEQASEIKGILSEINAIGKKEEPVEDVVNDMVEEDNEVGEVDEVREVNEVNEVREVNEVDEVREVNEVREVREVREVNEVREVGEEVLVEAPVSVKAKGQSVFPMLLLGIFIGVALVYILSYLNILPGLKLPAYQAEEQKVLAVVPESEPLPDTIIVAEVVEEEPIDTLQQIFDTPRIYEEFLASEKVVPGSRLTRIAERHYGVKLFWVFVYEANKEKIPDPENVPVGILLKIPRLDPRLTDVGNERIMNYLLELQNKYLKK